MVPEEVSLKSNSVSRSPRLEWGHTLALLLTGSREKNIQPFKCSVLLGESLTSWCNEGKEMGLRGQVQGNGKERRRGTVSITFLFGWQETFKLVWLLLKSQPWGYMQASFFHQMLSFWVQKGLLIILIKGGQWIRETIRCMRVLAKDLNLGCL